MPSLNPLTLYITIGLLGALIGSFLNVVIYRLPLILEREWLMQCAEFLVSLKDKRKQSRIHCELSQHNIDIEISDRLGEPNRMPFNLMWPHSHCPQCKTPIRPWHNIPIISYLWLRGRCASCKASIPYRYPLVELLTALASVCVAMHTGLGADLFAGLCFTWLLIAVTFIDIDEHMLPDDITLFGMWIGLLVNTQALFASPTEAIIGAAIGYGALWLIYWAFKLLTGKEGMGYGDFKLMACVGAWLGIQALPIVILIASLVGLSYGGIRIAFGKQHKHDPIPFGPFIALGAWITFLWGDAMITGEAWQIFVLV